MTTTKQVKKNIMCFMGIHTNKRYVTTTQESGLNDLIIIIDHYQCGNCNKQTSKIRTSYYK